MLKDVLGQSARFIWHKENSLTGIDAVVIPGGFSYGDYLRTGAIERFSPIMEAVQNFAAQGGPVLGICNGFPILKCEAGLLPGALIRNPRSPQFRCEHIFIKTINNASPFTNKIPLGKVLRVPIAHGVKVVILLMMPRWKKSRAMDKSFWQYSDEKGELTGVVQPEWIALEHRWCILQ